MPKSYRPVTIDENAYQLIKRMKLLMHQQGETDVSFSDAIRRLAIPWKDELAKIEIKEVNKWMSN